MLEIYKKNITVENFFQDGYNLEVFKQSDYLSYPEFLKYFEDLGTITKHNLIIAIHFTYGWMPTMFDFRSDKFVEAIEILNKVKQGERLKTDHLYLLKGLLNNSLVGTSKLLHFINPKSFAIWDSRVYRYLTNKPPHDYKIGNCDNYLDYLSFCDYLRIQNGFDDLQKNIELKIGYSMTQLRVIELIMYQGSSRALVIP